MTVAILNVIQIDNLAYFIPLLTMRIGPHDPRDM